MNRPRELTLKDDMGSDKALRITQEADGDIIVSIINPEIKLNNVPEIQFCASGSIHRKLISHFSKMLDEYDTRLK